MKYKPPFVFLFADALFLLFCSASFVRATPGDLDPSFGGTGMVTTPFGVSDDGGNAMVIQPDGKIVVAGFTLTGGGGHTDFAVFRYNADGTLDATFSDTGKVKTIITDKNSSVGATTTSKANAVALQSDGKIVVAGISFQLSQDFAIVRYYPDGVLDSTFGGGMVIFNSSVNNPIDVANGVAVQSDGKIVVVGYSGSNGSDILLIRRNTNGAADMQVTTDLGGTDAATAVVIQSDGKIVVAGAISGSGTANGFALVRYNENGTLDTSFNGTGKVTTAIGTLGAASALALQPDGKLVVAGYSSIGTNKDFAVARYNNNGSLDTDFNGTGKVVTAIGSGNEEARAVAVQKDGKIVVAGYSSNGIDNDFALVRYTAAGILDSTFGSGGKLTTPVGTGNDSANGMALQNDGRIVAAGSATNANGDIAVIRYMGDAEIAVEYPAGTGLVDAISTLDFGSAVVGTSVTRTIIIKNTGGADLTGLVVNFDGPNGGEFTVTNSNIGSSIPPNSSATFTVAFAPSSAVVKTADLHITSNDSDESPFDIAISGRGFVGGADDDGDGMTNAAEINLAALGFDPLMNNASLRMALFDNALGVGLYRASDMQTLAMGNPLLSQDPNTGHFHLIISVDKSQNLMTWSTLSGFGATYDPNTGEIDMDITPDASNPQFFRVLGSKP